MNKKRLSLIIGLLVLVTFTLSLAGCDIVYKAYRGDYEGGITGDLVGTWSGKVGKKGAFSGTCKVTVDEGTGPITAEYSMTGEVSKTGKLKGSATRTGTLYTKIEFEAQITGIIVTGTWKMPEGAQGTFTGKKK
ncbi:MULTISPECIES: hypothetical protein [unclassified Treponema]|uniref:hypothetical protein n=1 Tax=unclassified Treponema TaxID=2638727 RepID=UPI0020A45391|nr:MULTISPECIES: hypothetical protein [unclassified Treponema]UTC68411.1 hypothetical protein E4O06_07215 [Treponema sp. OMZ 789]UTC71131.1 hypothetical protein E4O01_07355 [Treponema sp. OMZ 790]UTC71284.1 hypothetical protein E4O02_07545 [Treponema sp. OMZ 791]